MENTLDESYVVAEVKRSKITVPVSEEGIKYLIESGIIDDGNVEDILKQHTDRDIISITYIFEDTAN